MKRRLFTILSALSLLLFVAVVVLWVRSYFVMDRLFWQSFEDEGNRSYWWQNLVEVGRGGVGMVRGVQSRERDPASGPGYADRRSVSPPLHRAAPPEYPDFKGDPWRWGGFKYRAFSYPDDDPRKTRPRQYHWEIVVPFWAAGLATAALTSISVLLLARSRRHDRGVTTGLCPSCGYDLRATPGRCPECGLAPAAPPPPPTSRGNVQ